jgi:hypothetical protein
LEQQLVTAQGTYRQPMLIDQIGYLYGVVRRADQLPGRDVFERLEELRAEKAKLEGVMKDK